MSFLVVLQVLLSNKSLKMQTANIIDIALKETLPCHGRVMRAGILGNSMVSLEKTLKVNDATAHALSSGAIEERLRDSA